MTTKANKRVTIIRAPKGVDNPYFQMLRTTAQDDRLSFEARGVLAYLLSKADNWELQPRDLMNEGHCGRDRINRIIRELKDHHYLKAEQSQSDDGKFERNIYTLYETPYTEKPSTAKPLTENPLHKEDREVQSTESTITDAPAAVSGAPSKRAVKSRGSSVPAVRMNPMKDAIANAFHWHWTGDHAMTPEEKGMVQKTARSLCLANVQPDQVGDLYAYCEKKFDNFTPIALSKHVSNWRQKHKNGQAPVPTSDLSPTALLEQSLYGGGS